MGFDLFSVIRVSPAGSRSWDRAGAEQRLEHPDNLESSQSLSSPHLPWRTHRPSVWEFRTGGTGLAIPYFPKDGHNRFPGNGPVVPFLVICLDLPTLPQTRTAATEETVYARLTTPEANS